MLTLIDVLDGNSQHTHINPAYVVCVVIPSITSAGDGKSRIFCAAGAQIMATEVSRDEAERFVKRCAGELVL